MLDVIILFVFEILRWPTFLVFASSLGSLSARCASCKNTSEHKHEGELVVLPRSDVDRGPGVPDPVPHNTIATPKPNQCLYIGRAAFDMHNDAADFK